MLSAENIPLIEEKPKKNRWKFLALLVVVVCAGWLIFSLVANQRTIDGLVSHLQRQGLAVAVAPQTTPEEQRVLQEFQRRAADFGQKTGLGTSVAESRLLVIDGIEVIVTRYAREAAAQEAYALQQRNETRSQANDAKTGTPHARSDFFLNGNLLMRIDHYDVKPPVDGKITLGGEGVTVLDLNPQTVVAIRSAFAAY